MSSSDGFLQHKTTRREIYDRMFRQARERGLDDVIFMNERGEITEGAISNVFVETGSRLYTPPVRCGLLPGVYRRHMLESSTAAERVLRLADLQAAEAIYICNAVRGLRRVELVSG
jgi:para-aminobenzoate synthetase/4-amino-4-deoxychorismate lyase